jgi:hypothetical protein
MMLPVGLIQPLHPDVLIEGCEVFLIGFRPHQHPPVRFRRLDLFRSRPGQQTVPGRDRPNYEVEDQLARVKNVPIFPKSGLPAHLQATECGRVPTFQVRSSIGAGVNRFDGTRGWVRNGRYDSFEIENE